MTAPAIVVPDASVILKWVLPSADESGVEHALSLRGAIADGDVHALVPGLWLFEVGNILARRLPERATDMLDALMRFGLVAAVDSRAWMREALGLTRRYGVTFHDAAYHAHAIVSGGVFVTADERYVRRAAVAGFIKRLDDWDESVA